MAIPALLSKKANAPVMMRISREEESYIGRARTNMSGRARVGFTKDGRITALDLFLVQDSGAYGPMGDHRSCGNAASLIYQPGAMRWRAINVLTNTPPRTQQRSPGPMQADGIMEPIVTKAAKQLGLDQVAIRRINAPEGKAIYGPPGPNGMRPHVTSAFVKEALDRGRRGLRVGSAQGTQRPAARTEGSRHRRRSRPTWCRLRRVGRHHDHPARRQALRAVGCWQSRDPFRVRSCPRRRRRTGDAVGEGRGHLGQHRQASAQHVPVGRQPDDARDDARQLRRRHGCEAQAAGDRGDGSRRLAGRLRARQRARLSPRQSGAGH